MRHTKGPWRITDYASIVNADGNEIARDLRIANSVDARLIVAAPEMYELLNEIKTESYDIKLLTRIENILSKIEKMY